VDGDDAFDPFPPEALTAESVATELFLSYFFRM
jgi:hypothetical protein